jgi:hypothetical protein
VTQWRDSLSGWCKHLRFLALSLIMLAAYAKLRAWHYNEGLVHFLYDDHRFLDLLTIDLAICGIYYAVGHAYEMGRQLEELRKLEGSLSTRRKGPFPQYLIEIGGLAETANHLDVLVDCLDYGSFFLPKVHQEVHDKICFAAGKRGIPVRILVCGEVPEPFTGASGELFSKDKASDELLRRYFSALKGDTAFQGWVERLDSQNDSEFDKFRETWFRKPKPTVDTLRAGIKACAGEADIEAIKNNEALRTAVLQVRQVWFAEELQRADVKIRALSNPQPMFFWLKYSEGKAGGDVTDDGLFTFAKAARGPSQLGYITHDPPLLDTFSAIFEDRWSDAGKEKEPEWLQFLKKQCLL